MFNFNVESIGLMLLSTFYALGKPALEKYLDDLHTKSPSWYKAVLFVGIASVEEAAKLAANTNTQIDDTAVADIKDAIQTSANTNGITL